MQQPATRQHATRQHAIVMGGSIGGLLAARVLSDHFDQVTILERDPVQDQPESRKGQPQTRHVHGLLAGGYQILTHYFPDLPNALADGGAVINDMAQSMRWYTHGGYRRCFQSGLVGVAVSRPLLEHLIRRRVLARPNVTLRDNCAVQHPTTTPDPKRITGVVVKQRNSGSETTTLAADLLLDCTGRGSRTPQWLVELGYNAPPISEIKVDIGYTTRLYHRNPTDPRGQQWTVITPHAPHETRFGSAFAIEDDRWIISIGGWGGDHCPADEAAFVEFARSLPAPDVYDIIRDSAPLSDILVHKMAASLRRHYEKLNHFPQGYLVLGDAIASINPTYGQGMTSAAMQAQALDELLTKDIAPDRLAADFFKRAAKAVDISWDMAAGEDFRFATTRGPKPLGTDFLNWYTAKLERATHHDEVVGAAFMQVMNMLAPATILLKPGIIWRTFRPRRADKAAPHLQPALSD